MKKLCAMLIALTFMSQCVYAQSPDARNEAAGVYAQIEMSDTIHTLAERFGEGVVDGDFIRFGDALCSFYQSGRLRAKSIVFSDIHEVAALTDGDFETVKSFKQGTDEEELRAVLGDGCEVLMMNLSDEDDAALRKLVAWKNESNAVLEALFELDGGKWALFAIGEIK